MSLVYRINRCESPSRLVLDWDAPEWQRADVVHINNFRPESSDHRPEVLARLLWSDTGFHGIYKVADRYVRCVRTDYFSEVWKDSCVEFFVKPKEGKGYFNFEFNCGGAFLCYYITDHRRSPAGFAKAEKIPAGLAAGIQVRSSMPRVVDPEIAEPTTWFLSFSIPFSILEHYTGAARPLPGERWRGNFFKCAEEVSHPHWAAWSPVPELNFHLPECFGDLVFGAP